MLDQVIAGEYAIGLQVFNDNVVISRRQGAPVDWVPMNPALAVLSVISVTQNAPHPNAGKLLEDFVVGPGGDRSLRATNDLSAGRPGLLRRAIPTCDRTARYLRAAFTWTPERFEADLPTMDEDRYDELLFR